MGKSARRNRSHRRDKRNGYIVKGITRRHWWDRYDKDLSESTRLALKRDTLRELREMTDPA